MKEHAASAGRRPRDFYRQIREFKNVVIVDVRELGLELVRKAAAVVTITGTSGFEAATMGKPTIVFGRHTIYSFLPHVRVVTDEVQLAGYLDDFLSGRFDAQRAAVDGPRLLKAIAEVSFEMDARILSDPHAFTPQIVQACYERLLASLRHGAVCDDPITRRPMNRQVGRAGLKAVAFGDAAAQ